jgi:hypothetical protein
MDIIYKAFITVLSLILLLSAGLSLTLSMADEIERNHYFASVTELLVDSHYNENIKNLLIEEAQQKGCELQIELLGSNSPGSYRYAEVTLLYDFHLDMFGIVLPRVKHKII